MSDVRAGAEYTGFDEGARPYLIRPRPHPRGVSSSIRVRRAFADDGGLDLESP